MDKSVFTGKNVIVQGITGKNGLFHTRNMVAYGTDVVAGVTPGKGGLTVDEIPVYDSIADVQGYASGCIGYFCTCPIC